MRGTRRRTPPTLPRSSTEMEYALFPTVGEIAQKNICRVSQQTTIREAARLMHERSISSVIIERQGLRYLFTVEDLLQFANLGRDDNIALGSVLSHQVQCIQFDERVLAAPPQARPNRSSSSRSTIRNRTGRLTTNDASARSTSAMPMARRSP